MHKIGSTRRISFAEVVGVDELVEKIDICNRDPLVHKGIYNYHVNYHQKKVYYN